MTLVKQGVAPLGTSEALSEHNNNKHNSSSCQYHGLTLSLALSWVQDLTQSTHTSRRYYDPHYIDEETEANKGSCLPLERQSRAWAWQSNRPKFESYLPYPQSQHL